MGGLSPDEEGKMEGWLYLIRLNRFGLQYSRKRYFVLGDNCLKSFKSKPSSNDEEPLGSAIIDSCIRVTEHGRESYHRKVFFIFTLYNTSDHNDQLKFGATSSEESANWIHALQKASVTPPKNYVACSKRKWQPFRLSVTRTALKKSVDWTSDSCMHVDAMTSDVIAPSPWKIFGSQNGLRLFKEAKDKDSGGRIWDDHPAIMAVGVIEGSSEAIFHTLMSLGASRSEWDYCFHRANVVEHLDGHNDIIHIQLCTDWLPWGMKRRDFLLRRYWRREDDGTYVLLFHSVYHRKYPQKRPYVRAILKSGGYVITPGNQGKESVVKHMLAIDWKFWRSYLSKSSSRSITVSMLERVAALRELFKAKAGNYPSEFSSLETSSGTELSQMEKNIPPLIKMEDDQTEKEEEENLPSSLLGLNEADEFFDVPEPSDYDQLGNGWCSPTNPDLHYADSFHPRKSSAAGFVKKLHDLAVQKKGGYMDLQEATREESAPCAFGTTLVKDSSGNMPCSWTAGDPSSFLIRGKNYLRDRQKVKAKGTLMQMVAADWLRSDKREDDLGSRPGSLVQKYAANGGPEFFFIVNIQVPGATTYGLALYFMTKTPLKDTPLLERFVNGDDAYRNSRFKLIPYISQGSWIVKQSVGKKACLVGQALETTYYQGKNYLELEVDVGSSTVARGVVSLVIGYLNNLVIEMAFLIQAETDDELPEILLGTCRLNHLDISKTAVVTP